MKFKKYIKLEEGEDVPAQTSYGKMIIINENASNMSPKDLALMEQRMSFEADRMVDRLTRDMMQSK